MISHDEWLNSGNPEDAERCPVCDATLETDMDGFVCTDCGWRALEPDYEGAYYWPEGWGP